MDNITKTEIVGKIEDKSKKKKYGINEKVVSNEAGITEYNKKLMKLSPINRLKAKYGVEKNVALSKENVEGNRELIEKYVQYFSAYPDKL